MVSKHIILASNSPRRAKLLQQMNLNFTVLKINYNEKVHNYSNPLDYSIQLCESKLQQAIDFIKSTKQADNSILLVADTIVTLDNIIYEKPKDEDDAFKILSNLSNKTHQVITSFGLFNLENNSIILDYEITDVTFIQLTDNEIIEYIKTGSSHDKAGAYGIQDDYAAVFIKKINGCYYNVVGLPVSKLYQRLKELK